jgi:hypothetical protein
MEQTETLDPGRLDLLASDFLLLTLRRVGNPPLPPPPPPPAPPPPSPRVALLIKACAQDHARLEQQVIATRKSGCSVHR